MNHPRFILLLLTAVLGVMAARGISEPESAGNTSISNDWSEFDTPKLILDGSQHNTQLFPQFADFDGDGKIDMLVGVKDRLLVYQNSGTNAQPEYVDPTWFDEMEPTGRIPRG